MAAALDGSIDQPGARTVRRRALVVLPVISVIPVLVFAVIAVVYVTSQQRRALESEIVQVARLASQAADLLIEERAAALRALGSVAADRGAEEFAAQARLLLAARPDWRSVALRGPAGETIAYEGRPDTTAVERWRHPAAPADAPPATVERLDDRRPILVLAQRVTRPARDSLAVSATLDLAPFSQILGGLADPNWTVAVLDPARTIAGRSRNPWRHAGKPATASLRTEMETARERFFYALNQEGSRVYSAFSTSPRTQWSAAVGVPARLIEAPLQQARLAWIGGGTAAVLLAGLLAWVLMRNLQRSHIAERRAWQLESEREAEDRLTEIASNFPGVMYRRVLRRDGTIAFPYLSPGVGDIFGHDAGDSLARQRPIDEFVGSFVAAEDRPMVAAALRRSAQELTPLSIEWRVRHPDGRIVWIRSNATTRQAEDGSITWDGVMMDVTPLKTTEHALKAQSEALRTVTRVNLKIASELDRENLVQAVLDAGRHLTGAAFGAFFYTAGGEGGDSFTLYKLSGARAADFAGFPMPRNTAIFGPVFRGEGIIRLDDVTRDRRYGRNAPYRGMPEGHLPVRSYLAAPVVSRSGDVLGGLFFGHPEPGVFDETAEEIVSGIAAQAAVALENARLFKAAEDEIAHRRDVEAQQRMLLAELNHRVKNSLAVVLAIAQQTARSSGTVEQFSEVFRGRIMALANAHTLLTAGEWRSTTLEALVTAALQPHCEVGGERVSVAGPRVVVLPKQALALSLVFHELATNASKYGALSTSGGSLGIDWGPGDEGWLVLRWRERTGRAVTAPEREGFGSKLITTNISRELGGSVSRDFGPDGFSAEIRLPWNETAGILIAPDEPSGTAPEESHAPA